jgi:uncharacterized DUF497 family protein
MVFTWDPKESAENLRTRGFDFCFASVIFDGATLEKEDRRQDYGERRIIAVGIAEGFHLTVVYTDRIDPQGDLIRRIISARRSNRRERGAYQKATLL